MKRALLAVTLLLCSTAEAQRLIDPTTSLRDYAGKVLPRCPAGVLTVERVDGGPTGFQTFAATLKSSDQYCGSQKYMLYSPKSQQVVIGSVIPLPQDGRAANLRIADQAGKMLGKQVKVTIAPFPLQDGLKAVSISRDTEYGPFSYNGYTDQSEQFLIIGFRGSLNTDPAKSLRDTLNTATGARRGSGKVEILELSDFQCPTCARAHEKIEPIIKQNIGKMSYVRLDLPLFEHHEWSIPAAMGARAIQQVAPGKYWAYVDYIFKNQESIGERKNFDAVIKDWVSDNDLDWAPIQKIYGSKAERQALLEQVSRAFSLGIASTPTFIVNGQIMGFGPEGSFTIDAIKQAVGAAASTPAKKSGK